MHKSFATCASQYSWSTVIENPSNGKEIWSRYGIQAYTSISCYDDSCTNLLGNLCFPLTFKRTWIYALVISNKRTAGTFVKTMAVFSTVYHVLLYTAILPLYINCPTFTDTKRTCKKWFICPAILGKSSLVAESWCLRYKDQARFKGIL